MIQTIFEYFILLLVNIPIISSLFFNIIDIGLAYSKDLTITIAISYLISSFILWFWMFIHCCYADFKNKHIKVIWCFICFMLFTLGSTLYFIFIYKNKMGIDYDYKIK